MSAKKTIQFDVTIHAPVETVWNNMLRQTSYQLWTKAFCEGSRYEGDWSEGNRMRFLDPAGDGMVAEIAVNRPHEFLSIRHLGYVLKGEEDTTSAGIREWAPALENYTFESVPEGTRVTVDQEVAAEFEQFIRDAWPQALEILKQLCETHDAE